jgi:deazaflavin-dependent oxidoreductase (nitroreductase family)
MAATPIAPPSCWTVVNRPGFGTSVTFSRHGTVRRRATRPHYREPDWFTRNLFKRVVAGFTRLGISIAGSRVLEVPGRKSGKPRRTPVNLLAFDGNRYLVAPRGQTQWVRNLRAAGRGNLQLGRRSESRSGRSRSRTPRRSRYCATTCAAGNGRSVFGGVGPDSPADGLAQIRARPPGLPHRALLARSRDRLVEKLLGRRC